jgi:hypothetical protein
MSLGLCSLDTSSLRHLALQTPARSDVAAGVSLSSQPAPARPGNMHYAHVSVASVEADRPSDYVRTSTAVLIHKRTYTISTALLLTLPRIALT